MTSLLFPTLFIPTSNQRVCGQSRSAPSGPARATHRARARRASPAHAHAPSHLVFHVHRLLLPAARCQVHWLFQPAHSFPPTLLLASEVLTERAQVVAVLPLTTLEPPPEPARTWTGRLLTSQSRLQCSHSGRSRRGAGSTL